MILGHRAQFSTRHYEAHRGTAPAELCELVVHCLELVAQLAHRELPFRFKGGNSLLVLLEDPQRFSIDVDIVTTAEKQALTTLVEGIARDCELFTRWEARAPKTKPWLPLISFKLFFQSRYMPADEAFVMLDAVLEPAPYPGVRRPVRCGAIYESGLDVEVPSISGLIGDKLLTLGPRTLGIPLGKNKEAQRLKHVFDVALLSRQAAWTPALVRDSLRACKAQEEAMQGRSFGWQEIVEDTLAFVGEALEHEVQPSLQSLTPGTYLEEVVKGFADFRRHLFRIDYSWASLREDCRRVRSVLAEVGEL